MPPRTLTPLQRKIAYGAFFALAFLFSLRRTFPFEALRDRLVIEAAAQGWQVKMGDMGPSGLLGFSAEQVVLESATTDGLRIDLDEVQASVSLLRLLVGRQRVSFDAELYEGEVEGTFEVRDTSTEVALQASGLNLAQAGPVKKVTGLDLAGVLKADVDLSLDGKDPKKSAGKVAITLEKAAINGGQIPVPGMGGGFPMPKVGLGAVTANATVADGKANIDKLEAKGDDVLISTDGVHAVMQRTLRSSQIFGKAKLKLNDGFWQKSGTATYKGLAEAALASAKGPDGAYTFQLSGSLGDPKARPVSP